VFTKEIEQLLHSQAVSQYEARAYDKASGLFRFLTLFCPTNHAYWYGLGASLMLAGCDRDAIQPFQIASVYAPDDAKIRMHLAECHARLGETAIANQAFDEAESLAQKPLLQEIRILRNTYDRHIQNH
jgi:Flp pilus assembly protein TadD